MPGKDVLGVGGAMDLVVGARRVIVTMTATSSRATRRSCAECTYPLTARAAVDVIVTELSVFRVRDGALVLVELLGGASEQDVRDVTAAPFTVDARRPDSRRPPERARRSPRMELVLRLLLGGVLLAAAGGKLRARAAARDGLIAAGVPAALAPVAVIALAAVEAALAAAVLAGIAPRAAGLAACALGALFAAVLGAARLRGRRALPRRPLRRRRRAPHVVC